MFKIIISNILYYSGFLLLVKFIHCLLGKRITIITFHRVDTFGDSVAAKGLSTLFIKPETFKKAIAYLATRYTTVSLNNYLEMRQNQAKLPCYSLVITFDDGYRDNFLNAFPVLRDYKLPFTLFLPSDILNGGVDFWWDRVFMNAMQRSKDEIFTILGSVEPSNSELQRLTAQLQKMPGDKERMVIELINSLGNFSHSLRKDVIEKFSPADKTEDGGTAEQPAVVSLHEIEEMLENGCEIGSHSKSHCFLDTVPGEVATREIVESKCSLELLLNVPVRHFAYPAGRWSGEIRDIVANANYGTACSTLQGVNHINCDPLTLKRVNVSESLITGPDGRFHPRLFEMRLVLSEYIAMLQELKKKICS